MREELLARCLTKGMLFGIRCLAQEHNKYVELGGARGSWGDTGQPHSSLATVLPYDPQLCIGAFRVQNTFIDMIMIKAV